MNQADREHFRQKVLDLIRDYPDETRLEYLRNYVAESPCTCHHTQQGEQVPGPHCPTAKTLAFILEDVVDPGDWIKAISINGQTGLVQITAYTQGGEESVQAFNLRGVSSAVE